MMGCKAFSCTETFFSGAVNDAGRLAQTGMKPDGAGEKRQLLAINLNLEPAELAVNCALDKLRVAQFAKIVGPDSGFFALLSLGIEYRFNKGASMVTRKQVEAVQIPMRDAEMQNILAEAGADPDRPAEEVPNDVRRRLREALADSLSASKALKSALRRSGDHEPRGAA